MPLDFLGRGTFVAHVCSDAPDTDLDRNPNAVRIPRWLVDAGTTGRAEMTSGSGHAMRLLPATEDERRRLPPIRRADQRRAGRPWGAYRFRARTRIEWNASLVTRLARRALHAMGGADGVREPAELAAMPKAGGTTPPQPALLITRSAMSSLAGPEPTRSAITFSHMISAGAVTVARHSRSMPASIVLPRRSTRPSV